jgi:hypothetical protein
MGEFNLKNMSAEVFISLQLSYLFMVSSAIDLWVGGMPNRKGRRGDWGTGRSILTFRWVAGIDPPRPMGTPPWRGFFRDSTGLDGFSNRIFGLWVGNLDVSGEEE